MNRLPVIASAAFLLGAGAWRAWSHDLDTVSAALIAAGLVALGVWLALEARR